jgi:hypothetical protein
MHAKNWKEETDRTHFGYTNTAGLSLNQQRTYPSGETNSYITPYS